MLQLTATVLSMVAALLTHGEPAELDRAPYAACGWSGL